MADARRKRIEKRLRIEAWKEKNRNWHDIYNGMRKALRKYPVDVRVKVEIAWQEIALGIMVGAFPYALLLFYFVER